VVDDKWNMLCKNFGYINGDFADPALYENVNKAVNDFKTQHPEKYNVIVYLAVSPIFLDHNEESFLLIPFVKGVIRHVLF
jgi:glucose-6-phosphate 1-dehydrogenase